MNKHQFRTSELSMRVLEMTREHAHRQPEFLMKDIARRVVERYGTSLATAYRYVRTAVDVLGIDYDVSARMKAHHADRTADGQADARCFGWPNGKPGMRASHVGVHAHG